MIIATTKDMLDRHVEMVKNEINQEIHVYSSMKEVPESIRRKVKILLTYGNDLNESTIEDLTNLKWIQSLSAGVENLPSQSIEEKGIIVTNARGIHAIPMSEYIIGYMLFFQKNIWNFLKRQTNRSWDREIDVEELFNESVIVFGTGAIGQAIAEKAKHMGMKVDGVNTSGRNINPFDQVFTVDTALDRINNYTFVVNVLPSTPSTKGLFSKNVLDRLKDSAVFMNIGRGDAVDESALYEILKSHQIRGAVLDVFVEEPLPANHPFWGLENVIITPHSSSKSEKYIDRCMKIFLENYKMYRKGQKQGFINEVNLERHY